MDKPKAGGKSERKAGDEHEHVHAHSHGGGVRHTHKHAHGHGHGHESRPKAAVKPGGKAPA